MSDLTEQEVFDTIVNSLRAQGCKSSDGFDTCCYRGENNTKCAAGHLILDSEYGSWMEGMVIGGVTENKKCPSSLLERMSPHLSLIGQLQSVHDGFPVSDWEDRFEKVAQAYSLKYTEPT
jgi:hypothetical protein